MRTAIRARTPVDPDAQAIARTVIYASLFDYPLTLAQVRASLVESSLTEDEVLATYRGSGWLKQHIEYEQGFFFPAGRSRLIELRHQRERFSIRFLERHRRVLQLICALPFVRMVAISGSLAHMNLDEHGDLDLFVITRGHHVWSVTVAIVVLAKLLHSRRTVCANFVMADTRLGLDQRDLFTANQVVHLKPITGAETFREFVAANPFVTKYYPNFAARSDIAFPFPALTRFGSVQRIAERLLGGPSRVAEAVCRRAYGWYLRRHSASWRSPQQVRLEADYLKLHTQSHRDPVLEKFGAAVTETLGWD